MLAMRLILGLVINILPDFSYIVRDDYSMQHTDAGGHTDYPRGVLIPTDEDDYRVRSLS